MVVAYEWGLKFLSMIKVLEDFFLYQPFEDVLKVNLVGQWIFDVYKPPWAISLPSEILELISRLSIGQILISSSIIGILVFKIAKFFIGIITGS